MKRTFSILLVYAAAAVLLAAAAVPHHHHGAEFCTETARHADNEDSHDRDCEGFCVAESEYTDRTEREDRCDCGSAACGHEQHVHLATIASAFALLVPDEPATETDYGECDVHLRSIDAPSGRGLRAPPAVLC